MFRNILRTSRGLARREINKFVPVAVRHLPRLEPVQTYFIQKVQYNTDSEIDVIDPIVYESICNETLYSLAEYFEQIIEDCPSLKGTDVTYSDGVLTVSLGPKHGIYVINRQSPNKQIWLSSPTSGPKRYDLVLKNGGFWQYKHDKVTLHELLQEELSKVVPEVDFSNCAHGYIPTFIHPK